MDEDAPLWTIGRLAARTGVPVKTIRFWSDRGLVAPSGRTDAGYRLYDEDALARLELVRTLRELGSTSRRSGASWPGSRRWRTSPPHTRTRSTRRSARCGSGGRSCGSRPTERGGAALAAGIDPTAPEARPIVADIAGAFAQTGDERDGPAFRAELADRIESGTDARAERYWQLLAIVNGWPEIPTTVPAWEWTIAALRAS